MRGWWVVGGAGAPICPLVHPATLPSYYQSYSGWRTTVTWWVVTIIITMGLSSVSISFTTAIVYIVSGVVFFLLIFLLVMVGVTDCNCDCSRYFLLFCTSVLVSYYCLLSRSYNPHIKLTTS